MRRACPKIDFMKRSSLSNVTPMLAAIGPAVVRLAQEEGLMHGRSISIRLNMGRDIE